MDPGCMDTGQLGIDSHCAQHRKRGKSHSETTCFELMRVLSVALALATRSAAEQVSVDASGAQAAFNVGAGSVEEVSTWLDEIGFGDLKKSFAKHVIDGPALREITEEELKELGVKKVGYVLHVRCI